MLCHIMSCHVMSCHITSCHVMSHYVMSCHVMSHYVMSCHVMSHYVMSCHAMPHYVMSCHVMSHNARPCHKILCHMWYTSKQRNALWKKMIHILMKLYEKHTPCSNFDGKLIKFSPLKNIKGQLHSVIRHRSVSQYYALSHQERKLTCLNLIYTVWVKFKRWGPNHPESCLG